ncbi:MAG: tyrosine-type recombinase/integrase [Desulfobulbaceae bacterium]|nr:tyrosine-type recombinase/integrase [Desulfobulbaceae bacterium]
MKQYVIDWGIPLPKGIVTAQIRKPTKFPNLRFHDLRHEATSRLFEKGLNIMEVASITGHKDLRSLQRYTHLKAEDLVEKLG